MSEPSPTTTPADDPALDHRRAERAGVEVDEALVHHGGARGQVRAEADPVGVGDPDAARDHVVDHARELVDAVDREMPAGGALDDAQLVDAIGRARPGRRPGDVRQQAEDAVEVGLVRRDQRGARAGAAAGTRRRRSSGASASDSMVTSTSTTATPCSARRAGQGRERPASSRGRGAEAEVAGRKPGVERLLAVGHGGQAGTPRGAGQECAHRSGHRYLISSDHGLP